MPFGSLNMKKFYLIIALLVSVVTFAQPDTGNRSISIPLREAPQPSPPAAEPSEKTPSFKDPIPEPRGSIEKPNNFTMTPKNDFANPNQDLEDRMNKRGEGNQYTALRRNQHLGDYRTGSPYIVVHYRDHGQIDGDRIQLINNDQIVLLADVLTGDFKRYRIDLTMGINKIDVLALNNGALFPNTAAYEIYDVDGTLITANSWEIFADFKATIIIVRE